MNGAEAGGGPDRHPTFATAPGFGWTDPDVALHVTEDGAHHDAFMAIQLAIDEAERLNDTTLLKLLTDPATEEIRPIALITDNGPAFKADGFARFIDSRPELIHIRTRCKSPQQDGVRERAFGSLRYEHLYRLGIPDGPTLAVEVEAYRQTFNWIRRHEAIGMKRPMDLYLTAPNGAPTLTLDEPETLPLSCNGTEPPSPKFHEERDILRGAVRHRERPRGSCVWFPVARWSCRSAGLD